MPQLDHLRARLRGENAEVLAVCINGTAGQVAAFRKEHGVTLPIVASGSRVAAMYGVDRVPTSLIVDQTGRIVARWQGARDDLLRRGFKAGGMDLPAGAGR